jgi:AraC-like DNA-binding protein
MPIKEIGYECGYISIAYFNHNFKKLTGVSPGDSESQSKEEKYPDYIFLWLAHKKSKFKISVIICVICA